MTEETRQSAEVGREVEDTTKERLSDLLGELGFEESPDDAEVGGLSAPYSYPTWPPFNPNQFFYPYHHMRPGRGLKTFVSRDKGDGLVIFFSSRDAGEEAEVSEKSFTQYLAQIDQSRERAQNVQPEIDQLRTETRQLIAQLFAA
jgi:hypothetical protein